MKVSIVPIGNSKGIRIPKAVLQQCNIKKHVDIEVENGHMVIRPYHERPRQNWGKAFEKMHKNNDDQLIIDDNLDLEIEDWTW
ncbi:MAG: transcriptional regulator [Candidatus Scalindua rubra]|uniref:Transcriptional regulator n=1 Tax=Candidatus Scalindua rubra TaxID=1872076 RepID=A0A1E3X5C2_9BACT|nr:MAG: transcriptional regulator [Candidatus Scalindua rubra]